MAPVISVLGKHKWAKEIHAWAEGNAIQYLNSYGGNVIWVDILFPAWTVEPDVSYRIKVLQDPEIDRIQEHIDVINRELVTLIDHISKDTNALHACNATLVRLNNLLNLK